MLNASNDATNKNALRDGDGVILVTIKSGANERSTTRELYIRGAGGPEPLSPEHAILLQQAGIPVVAVFEDHGRQHLMNRDTVNEHAVALLKDRAALKVK